LSKIESDFSYRADIFSAKVFSLPRVFAKKICWLKRGAATSNPPDTSQRLAGRRRNPSTKGLEARYEARVRVWPQAASAALTSASPLRHMAPDRPLLDFR
jgi:hypothetical protein